MWACLDCRWNREVYVLRLPAALILLAFCSGAVPQEDPGRILQRAIGLHQAGNVEAAIPQYRAYLKLRPEAVDARSNLGAALSKAGRYAEAIPEYRQALRGRPGDPHIRLNLALANYKLGRIGDAAAEFAGLHASQPDNSQVMLLLADCWLRQGEYKQVIELLTPVEKRNVDDLAIAYLLGTALLRDKQVDRGQQIIDRILRNGDSAEARLLLGTAKLEAAEYEGALADLKKAVELNPALPDAHSYLGRAHIELGDTASARKDFEAELQQNPNDFESNLNLGALLKQDHDYDGARKLLDRALRTRPGDLRARFQLASVNLEDGKLDAARNGLEQILKQAPEFVEAHISLATAYYRLQRKSDGDREKALAQKLAAEQRSGTVREKKQ